MIVFHNLHTHPPYTHSMHRQMDFLTLIFNPKLAIDIPEFIFFITFSVLHAAYVPHPDMRPYKSPRVHTFCMSLSAHDNNDVIIVLSISLAVRSSTKTESQPRQDIASLLLDFDHLPKNIESLMTKSSMNTPEVNKPSILGLGRHVPTLPYAIQNVLMSVASIIAATLSLIFTMSIVLPLSIARVVLPNSFFRRDIPGGRGKVVLIVGASRGIGFNVLKQYADEPDTVIIAASRSIGKHNWAITFPPASNIFLPARFASKGCNRAGRYARHYSMRRA